VFLVVGLGNPGRQYEHTRHNIGFAVVSELRRAWGLPDWRPKFAGLWTQGEVVLRTPRRGADANEVLRTPRGGADAYEEVLRTARGGADAYEEVRHAVGLLEPQTYMNNSGESVQPAAAFFRVELGELVVVHDELDLSWGTVRLKLGGGHAGNNGVRSIIERMGAPDFVRVRVGIGKPADREARDHVLSGFDALECAELPAVRERAADAVRRVLSDGLQAAMNVVNTRA
jgi:PTH1 family peptidyl-tRNA hydrolase